MAMKLPEYLKMHGATNKLIDKVREFRRKYDVPEKYADRVVRPHTFFMAQNDSPLLPALAALMAGDYVLLYGEKGSGKNVLASTLAFICGRPLFEVPLHVYADDTTLIGKDTYRDGKVEFQPSQLVQAMEAGGFLVLDEINMARPEVTAVLHGIMDDRRRIDIPGYGVVEAHPAFRIIGTMNYGYAGTQELNEALADRMVHVEVPYLSKAEIAMFLKSKFSRLGDELADQLGLLFLDISTAVRQGEVDSKHVSFRAILQALRMAEVGVPPRKALLQCLVSRSTDPSYRKIIEGFIVSRIVIDMPSDWWAPEEEDEIDDPEQ